MSNADLVQYIIEQASKTSEVKAKQMFGDYTVYCNNKVVGLICDDIFYLKPLKQLEPILREDDKRLQPPYDGAKAHYVITNVDDKDYISLLVKVAADSLPAMKK